MSIAQRPLRFSQISHNLCPNPDFLNFRRLFFILRMNVSQALQLKSLPPTLSILPVRNQSIDIVECEIRLLLLLAVTADAILEKEGLDPLIRIRQAVSLSKWLGTQQNQ